MWLERESNSDWLNIDAETRQKTSYKLRREPELTALWLTVYRLLKGFEILLLTQFSLLLNLLPRRLLALLLELLLLQLELLQTRLLLLLSFELVLEFLIKGLIGCSSGSTCWNCCFCNDSSWARLVCWMDCPCEMSKFCSAVRGRATFVVTLVFMR